VPINEDGKAEMMNKPVGKEGVEARRLESEARHQEMDEKGRQMRADMEKRSLKMRIEMVDKQIQHLQPRLDQLIKEKNELEGKLST
jgi:hypothetical protein